MDVYIKIYMLTQQLPLLTQKNITPIRGGQTFWKRIYSFLSYLPDPFTISSFCINLLRKWKTRNRRFIFTKLSIVVQSITTNRNVYKIIKLSIVDEMEPKQELIDNIYRLAFKYEAELGSCPQCVLAAIKSKRLLGC